MAAATPAAAAASAHAMFIYIHIYTNALRTHVATAMRTGICIHMYVIGHSKTLRIYMYMT